MIGDFPKYAQKNKYICLNKVIWLMTMKMRNMKNRLHKYGIIDLGLEMGINILNINYVSV